LVHFLQDFMRSLHTLSELHDTANCS
jgi:hypothetical protein